MPFSRKKNPKSISRQILSKARFSIRFKAMKETVNRWTCMLSNHCESGKNIWWSSVTWRNFTWQSQWNYWVFFESKRIFTYVLINDGWIWLASYFHCVYPKFYVILYIFLAVLWCFYDATKRQIRNEDNEYFWKIFL